MNPSLRALLVALPFVAAYFVMRSLPVTPCDFLHEETYNAEGVVDYCGGGDSAFVDLSLRKWPLSLDFRPLGELVPGQPCDFRLDITQFDGSPLTAEEVALSHTKKIHLLAVDESLSDYHHLHPEPDSLNGGVWYFTLTPENAGKYAIFLDFIPIRSPRRVLLTSFSMSRVMGLPCPVFRKNCRFLQEIGSSSLRKTNRVMRFVWCFMPRTKTASH